MSNIIDSIQLSGVTYTLSAQTSGEGKSVEAGRGISVASGTSAYTVSFNLPISAGTGSNSIAEGNYTQATGGQSHAEGDGTIANGISSHAEGASTTASGICSHAEGYYTQARGNNSHAEGNNAQARGNDSHAEGYETMAAGNYSHAEGYQTFVSSNYSHAEGYNTTVDGNYSHAEGNYTIAINQSEHASGQYNVSNNANNTFGNSGNTLFSVGNGTAYNARHNAFEIRQNGDIYITSGGTDIKLQDNLGGGGGNPTVELTQAEYDALVSGGTVDPTAFYIITDATAGDLSQYWTSAQTNSAINAAVSGKQDTLISGTNIKTINNESILGSGNIDIQGGGGGGITSGEVQTMIDESISGKTNQNDNLFTIRTNVIETVVVSSGAKFRIIFAFDIIQNNQIVLSTDTVNDKSSLLSSLATLGFDNKIYDIRGINYSEDTSLTSYFGEFLGHKCYAVLLGYVPDFGSITIGLKRNNVYYTLDSVGSGKYNYNYLSNKPAITTSISSSSTDAQVPSAKAVNDKLGGLSLVKLTQSEYDSLATKDNSTLYIVTN